MTIIAWVVVAVLAAAVVWLGLALAALVRQHATLTARVEALEDVSAPVPLGDGLQVGRQVPPWSITTPEGDTVTAASLAGRRHLLVFADPDCRACDELVPAVVRASAVGIMPPAVIVGRGDADAIPRAWRASTVGVERATDVSDAFGVDVSPFVFVVDDGGAVVASGGAIQLGDVEDLVAAGRDITIVRDAGG
jgi:hypothetical protein